MTTATITWSISALNCYPQVGDKTDVVLVCHWTCSGTDGTYTSSVYNTCSFAPPTGPSDEYTPYEDLTEDQVLGWVWSDGVDKDVTEAAVQSMLDNQINPPVVSPPLPWAV